MTHDHKGHRAGRAALVGDIDDRRPARHLCAEWNGRQKLDPPAGPHAAGQGDRRQEAAASRVAVGSETLFPSLRQEIEPSGQAAPARPATRATPRNRAARQGAAWARFRDIARLLAAPIHWRISLIPQPLAREFAADPFALFADRGRGPERDRSRSKICGGAGTLTGPLGVPTSARRNWTWRANSPTVL